MKYLFTAALAVGTCATSYAQPAQVKVIRTTHAASAHSASSIQAVLDKLQTESANTVVYPLVTMTKAALAKVQSFKKHANRERIRTNNNAKPKRTVNPNRV